MDEINYRSGVASFFASMARASGRYVMHYDFPNDQWNVFEIVGGSEWYVDSFKTIEAASDFCDKKNAEVQ